VRRFVAQATHRPSPSSQARTTAALRCFFRFCVENEYLERDPAAVLRSPKQREALPDIINRTELGQLLVVPGRVRSSSRRSHLVANPQPGFRGDWRELWREQSIFRSS